ncbi:hypothetical protein [Clostridium formicaceticum]|uniref:Uncharacterized protein n=1 Tax=Clostridium formicaceticum TaxID=1497 RepID=A0AAC9RIQ0_9CLOT|nr:hypothetical protein [Clostridium formicaceticum]AOY75928.1 hypothetical protein BJL90_08485 [Clostridium formicaceticum]ARE86274.1 hypothetical protein CLFO_05960 [Clostridium formicaceticum]
MGGYSCTRKIKETIKGKEAYGMVTIPSYYAGICPGDSDPNQIPKNVVPEIFFGFYCPNGIDIGIRVAGGGGWRPFCYGNPGICTGNDGAIFSTTAVKPGTVLYMRAWIEKVGTSYYAKLNVSKTGYSGTDLMSTPLSTKLSNSFGEKALSSESGSGCDVNREIVIAANPTSYETSGAYEINAKWGVCGVVSPTNLTYVWTDANSYEFPSGTSGRTQGASGKYVLQLRKDGGDYSPSRIKVGSVTNTTSGATETVSIDFRSTPQI